MTAPRRSKRGRTTRIQATIPDYLADQIRRMAEEEGTTVSVIVTRALLKGLPA